MTTNISEGTLRLCKHVLTLQLQMLNTLGYPALAMRDSLEEIEKAIEVREGKPLGIAKIIAQGGKDVKEWK
jgi:hypothetical protein